jgi:sn-glycerol 3-phosphate transport system substrate-binding protein
MRNWRSKLLVWGLIAILFLVTACGESGNGGTTTTSGGTTSGSTSSGGSGGSGGKVTVQFWHSLGGKNGERLDEMLKRFNESQDRIEVVGTYQGGYDETVTKLQQAISAGTAPEIAMIERAYVQMFAESGVLEDLYPYLDGSTVNIDDFLPGLMGHSVFNDQLVSLPFNRSTPILHVNKTLLDEHGLKVPTTWEELKEVANALVVKEGNEIKRYGVAMPYDTWYPIAMITQLNGTFFNEDNTSDGFVDNGIGKRVFEFLKDLQNSGALYYSPQQDAGSITNNMFIEQRAAMIYQSTGSIGGILSSVDFEYTTAFLPKGEVFATPTGGANISIIANTKNKDAAWEFIEWVMTQPEGALQFIIDTGYLPFSKWMAESPALKELWEREPMRKTAYEQLEYAIDTNKDVGWPSIMHEFFAAIEAIMYDSADIDSTLKTFQKEAERILEET